MGPSPRPKPGRKQPDLNPSLTFFRGFLRDPKGVASVIPSSKFLTRRVLKCGEVESARVIVELGAGTGVLTQQILDRMPADAKLIAIEIQPDFARLLRLRFQGDARLVVFEGSATDIERALRENDVERADLVVSGIPFSTLPREVREATLAAAKRCLSERGRFVAYQFRSHVRRFAEPVFGPAETHSGFWNVPPMKIYVWRHATA